MKNLDADVRGGGWFWKFGHTRTRGGGWFENPRFWRTSFVDGPKVAAGFQYPADPFLYISTISHIPYPRLEVIKKWKISCSRSESSLKKLFEADDSQLTLGKPRLRFVLLKGTGS